MALHSIYAGFMYNDVFSMGINLFGSRWGPSKEGGPPEPVAGGPYPFGVDPAWKGASNELLFLNSLKMKLAIIVRYFCCCCCAAAAVGAATVAAVAAVALLLWLVLVLVVVVVVLQQLLLLLQQQLL